MERRCTENFRRFEYTRILFRCRSAHVAVATSAAHEFMRINECPQAVIGLRGPPPHSFVVDCTEYVVYTLQYRISLHRECARAHKRTRVIEKWPNLWCTKRTLLQYKFHALICFEYDSDCAIAAGSVCVCVCVCTSGQTSSVSWMCEYAELDCTYFVLIL